jgi:hypothetical protein
MDFAGIVPVLTAVLGSGLTLVVGWFTQRRLDKARRDEREWEAEQRFVERDQKRGADEIDNIRNLYRLAALVGMEYREIEEGTSDAAESWKKFLPRFREVKAELFLRGSPEIAQAFVGYVTHVQASEAELDQVGYQRGQDGWEHSDAKMEELIARMRADVDRRLLEGSQRKMIATTRPEKVLAAGSATEALTRRT